MSDLIKELKEANIRGLNPPQNWTHRAIDEMESQQNQITKLEKAVKAANHLIHSHEMTVFLGVHRELSQEALAELNPQQEE